MILLLQPELCFKSNKFSRHADVILLLNNRPLGHDTTALNLSYLLMLLAEHKDIQDRVRNEVNTAFQENGKKFNIKLLQNLTYLNRCIKETLRLYPSVFLISRVAGKDVKLQSYLVPARTTVVLNIYGVHRDPNFWPNPETFDPDRFLPERFKNHHPFSYLPFSAGQRNCLGQQYALLQIKALIAPLIQNYYLEPIDYLRNLRLQTDLVLRPACPLRVKFVPMDLLGEVLNLYFTQHVHCE
ncbi:cytochrome P450 4C1-like [Temnothorax nylanderi]|uniref:cytochrome P450 4C1-like n=1 Tax=Temnothorax nylanderi TaxID=102681 RepID=UPI003A8B43C9